MTVFPTPMSRLDRASVNMARMACDGFFLERALVPIADGYQVMNLEEPTGDDPLRLAGFYWSPHYFPVAAIALPGPAEVPAECTDSWYEDAAHVALGKHAKDVLGNGFDQLFAQMTDTGTIVAVSIVADGNIAGPWSARPRPTQFI